MGQKGGGPMPAFDTKDVQVGDRLLATRTIPNVCTENRLYEIKTSPFGKFYFKGDDAGLRSPAIWCEENAPFILINKAHLDKRCLALKTELAALQSLYILITVKTDPVQTRKTSRDYVIDFINGMQELRFTTDMLGAGKAVIKKRGVFACGIKVKHFHNKAGQLAGTIVFMPTPDRPGFISGSARVHSNDLGFGTKEKGVELALEKMLKTPSFTVHKPSSVRDVESARAEGKTFLDLV